MRVKNEKLLYILLILIILPSNIVVSTSASSSPIILWHTFKHDYSRTGYVNESWEKGVISGYRILWNFTTDLCVTSEPVIGDIDGDGVLEAVFNSCDGYLYSVTAINGSFEWKYYTGGGFSDPTLADLDGDGSLEVLSVGSKGSLVCLDGKGGLEWGIDDRFFKGSPGIGDLDGDGLKEVVMGSDTGELTIVWGSNASSTSIQVGNLPVYTPSITDLDHDGEDEIIVFSGSNIVIVDFTANNTKIYSYDTGHMLISPPTLWDLNSDNIPEIIYASRDLYVGIFDIKTGKVVNTTHLDGVEMASSPSIGPLKPGNPPVIIVGTMNGLFILDTDLNIKYYLPRYRVYMATAIISDIDGDGVNEILIGQETGEFDIIDLEKGAGNLQEIDWAFLTNGPIMGAASIADIDNDGHPEILIGSRDYNLYCIKPEYLSTNTTTTTRETQETSESTQTSPTTSNHIYENMTIGPGKTTITPDYRLIGLSLISAGILMTIATLYVKKRRM